MCKLTGPFADGRGTPLEARVSILWALDVIPKNIVEDSWGAREMVI